MAKSAEHPCSPAVRSGATGVQGWGWGVSGQTKERKENTDGSPLTETPGSQYLPFTEIPKEVHDAAETLFIYFERQGMRRWEFSHVADRRLVVELERQRDTLKAELKEAVADLLRADQREFKEGGEG